MDLQQLHHMTVGPVPHAAMPRIRTPHAVPQPMRGENGASAEDRGSQDSPPHGPLTGFSRTLLSSPLIASMNGIRAIAPNPDAERPDDFEGRNNREENGDAAAFSGPHTAPAGRLTVRVSLSVPSGGDAGGGQISLVAANENAPAFGLGDKHDRHRAVGAGDGEASAAASPVASLGLQSAIKAYTQGLQTTPDFHVARRGETVDFRA